MRSVLNRLCMGARPTKARDNESRASVARKDAQDAVARVFSGLLCRDHGGSWERVGREGVWTHGSALPTGGKIGGSLTTPEDADALADVASAGSDEYGVDRSAK